MPYGGYGVCSDCYIIINDIKDIKQKAVQWNKKGYGSISECVDYIIFELTEFKKNCESGE